jgi:hypothetical protein
MPFSILGRPSSTRLAASLLFDLQAMIPFTTAWRVRAVDSKLLEIERACDEIEDRSITAEAEGVIENLHLLFALDRWEAVDSRNERAELRESIAMYYTPLKILAAELESARVEALSRTSSTSQVSTCSTASTQ